jgi:hypothetical protein
MFQLWRIDPVSANVILSGKVPQGGSPQADALIAAAMAAVARLGPRAAQPTCVGANQDLAESRTGVEVQDTRVFSEALRVVCGFGVRTQRASSDTFLAGSASKSKLIRIPWRSSKLIHLCPQELTLQSRARLRRRDCKRWPIGD